jgi:hypothetical protein
MLIALKDENKKLGKNHSNTQNTVSVFSFKQRVIQKEKQSFTSRGRDFYLKVHSCIIGEVSIILRLLWIISLRIYIKFSPEPLTFNPYPQSHPSSFTFSAILFYNLQLGLPSQEITLPQLLSTQLCTSHLPTHATYFTYLIDKHFATPIACGEEKNYETSSLSFFFHPPVYFLLFKSQYSHQHFYEYIHLPLKQGFLTFLVPWPPLPVR